MSDQLDQGELHAAKATSPWALSDRIEPFFFSMDRFWFWFPVVEILSRCTGVRSACPRRWVVSDKNHSKRNCRAKEVNSPLLRIKMKIKMKEAIFYNNGVVMRKEMEVKLHCKRRSSGQEVNCAQPSSDEGSKLHCTRRGHWNKMKLLKRKNKKADWSSECWKNWKWEKLKWVLNFIHP